MEIGKIYKITHSVSDNETAKFLGSGGLAAYSLAAEHGHQSVGTKVDISHTRACKPGTELIISAELTEIDGRRLEFKVKVEDSEGNMIGEGRHQRYIIDPERFMAKLG